MRIPAIVSLLCWSVLTYALEYAGEQQDRVTPKNIHEKCTTVPAGSITKSTWLQPNMAQTISSGYYPWVVERTGLTGSQFVYGVHVVDSNVAWGVAASDHAERAFIRTTNGGLTWTCDTVHSAGPDYCNRDIFAVDANTAWITMHYHNSSRGGGIFKTTDGGATWQQDSTAFKIANGFAVFIHFFDANNGVSVGDPPEDGYLEIYTTSNGGDSWSRVPKGNIPPMVSGEWTWNFFWSAAGSSLWFPTLPSYLGTGRFFRTTDKGLTWSVHGYPEVEPGYFTVFGFRDENVGLGNGSGGEVSRTTDGGLTWTRISSPSHASFQSIEPVPGNPEMYFGAVEWYHPSLEKEYLDGTAYTLDGGVNWTMACEMNRLAQPDFISASAGWNGGFDPDIGKWTIGQGRVIGTCVKSLKFKTLDLGSKSDTIAIDAVNFGSEPLTISSVDLPGGNFGVIRQPSLPATISPLGSVRIEICFAPIVEGAIKDSLVINSDASQTPGIAVLLEGTGFAPQPAEPGVFYAASGSLFRLDAKTGVPTLIDTLHSVPIHGLAVQPATDALFGVSASASSSTLYKIGSTSAALMPVRTFPVGDIRGITFANQDTLIAVTAAGKIYQLFISSGLTGFVGMGFGVSYGGVAISPGGKLFISGSTSQANDNMYAYDADAGEVTLVGRTGDNRQTPSIFFGPRHELYGLKGSGADTNTIVVIDTLTGVGSDLFSTGIQGLVAMTISDKLVESVEDQNAAGAPTAFSLGQNYPNPFNPSTTIKYELPKSTAVRLTVYDMLGREVLVLVNERRDAGYHEVRFDGSGLASGVYLYRLQAGDFGQVRKLVLVR